MPRIFIFSTAYLPLVGGAEIAIKEITDRLSGEYEFVLVTARLRSSLPRVEKVGGVMVYRVGFGNALDKFLLPILGFLTVLTSLRKKEPVLLWVVMVSYAGYIAYFLNRFRRRKIPIILTLQEGDSEAHLIQGRGGLIAFSWRLMLRNAAYVTAISSYLARLAQTFGYRGEVAVIPNGVDVALFEKIRSTNTPPIFEKGPEDIFLITTSRLVPKNAVDDVIRALPHLPRTVKFLVLGEGPERTRLHALAQMEGVSERVRFFGHVVPEDIPRYLAVADIFVRPSRSEGMGNSFIEAMAAGLPVVATQVGGIADFLFDAERNREQPATGFAVDRDAPEQIARVVERILAQPEVTLETVQRARTLVREKYDWNLIVRQMSKVFSSLE